MPILRPMARGAEARQETEIAEGQTMSDSYNPTEEQIGRVLDRTGGDPRKLAIAYLRAQHRARGMEAGFDLLSNITDAERAAMMGDGSGAMEALKTAMRRLRTHKATEQAFQGK